MARKSRTRRMAAKIKSVNDLNHALTLQANPTTQYEGRVLSVSVPWRAHHGGKLNAAGGVPLSCRKSKDLLWEGSGKAKRTPKQRQSEPKLGDVMATAVGLEPPNLKQTYVGLNKADWDFLHGDQETDD